MTDKEIYEQLKEGANPSYIDGLRHFDTSEVIQWMISYHQEVNAELLDALEMMILFSKPTKANSAALANAHAVINKALGVK